MLANVLHRLQKVREISAGVQQRAASFQPLADDRTQLEQLRAMFVAVEVLKEEVASLLVEAGGTSRRSKYATPEERNAAKKRRYYEAAERAKAQQADATTDASAQ